jgi:hypothetical protein
MFLNLDKREYQHMVMEYILYSLSISDEEYPINDKTLEGLSKDDKDFLIKTRKPRTYMEVWKREDPIWAHFLRFIANRSLENYIQQRWPTLEGRVRLQGRRLSEQIVAIRHGKDNDTVKVAL